MGSRRIHLIVVASLAIISAMPLPALSAATPTATSNPPSRVARLDYFSGDVTIEPAGANAWSHAELNWPLTTGDQLWTNNGGRAELQVGSSALHLGRQTALDIVDLDDRTMQIKVTQGKFAARIRTLPAGQDVEIDTPNLALQATSPGSFRVDVAPDGGSTMVTVRSGTATLYGDNASLPISAGQQIRFGGTHLQQQAGATSPVADSFDLWVERRDLNEDSSISARYVSPEIPGYQDLDANGTWQSDQTYGEVWVPTVAVTTGWVPYREGHWAWIAPWGWTWIDAAPWGFAPFHYGRWAQVGGLWAWAPGPYIQAWSPVYAPALVAFIGGVGSRFSWGMNLSIGAAMGAGVAWLPLGPGEMWHPGYGYSPGYFNRVNNMYNNNTNIHNTTIVNNNVNNIANIKNIHNRYMNQNIPGAITAVTAKTFVRGQSVAAAAIPLSARQIAHARIGAGAPAIAPIRASFLGGMPLAMAGEPLGTGQRQVIATRAPVMPPAYHDTLAQQYANHGGRVADAGKPVVHTTAPRTFISARSSARPNEPSMPQNFHVIDKTLAQTYGVHPWQQVSKYSARSDNGRIDAAHTLQSPHIPVMRQNRLAPQTVNPAPRLYTNSIHDFQVLHLPPQPQHPVTVQGGNREQRPYADSARTNPAPWMHPARQRAPVQQRITQPNIVRYFHTIPPPHPQAHAQEQNQQRHD
ncbi:MAG: DUF6600 domain-containing protein [Sulfuriferula sp.]